MSPPCPCCGGGDVVRSPVLWPDLVDAWELSPAEAASIDRREGETCAGCGNSLRSRSLAAAVNAAIGWNDTLDSWVGSRPATRLLEVNRAGGLTPTLERLEGHRLVEYPDVDLQRLPFPDGVWDVVVHSDTLEHVDDPLLGLRECRRVLRPGGSLCSTVPVVPGRLTRSRRGLPPSYHGTEADPAYLVVTEFGSDFWTRFLDAGFASLTLVPFDWPDGMALVAVA